MALVSDAGTPLISDPGYKLVRAARAAGHAVTPCRAPRAAIAALTSRAADRSLPVPRLPSGQGQGALRAIAELREVPATLVFYESGPRLGETLAALERRLGNRDAAVAREITKLHEECVTGTLAELAERYAGVAPKGEIVIVVGPPAERPPASDAELDRALDEALGRLSPSRAAAEVAERLNVPRKRAYARALDRAK